MNVFVFKILKARMILRPHFLLLAVLASLAQPSYADDGLSQTIISFYADGKPVGGLIFAIGSKPDVTAKMNLIEPDAKGARLSGNVQASLTPQSAQAFVLFGENVLVTKEAITPERAKAVQDIEAMAIPDQLYRGSSSDLTPAEWKLQTAIDLANMKRLAEIIATYGWPGLHFAGAASQTALMVLQHADTDSQRKYLPLVRDAVQRSDALAGEFALLEDRVRVSDGRPQLYGTQLAYGETRFAPIEDELHVDERRHSIGLPPLAEYAKMLGTTYTPVEVQSSGGAH